MDDQKTPPSDGEDPNGANVYHGDKINATLTLKNPGTPPAGKASRNIPEGPLYDLVVLQQKLRSGELDLGKDEHCFIATENCADDLWKLRWTTGDQVTKLLLLLRPKTASSKGDYYRSEWCKESDDGRYSPCDAYRIRVDQFNDWKRDVNAPLYYLKFCVEETGQIYFVLISCHLDKT